MVHWSFFRYVGWFETFINCCLPFTDCTIFCCCTSFFYTSQLSWWRQWLQIGKWRWPVLSECWETVDNWISSALYNQRIYFRRWLVMCYYFQMHLPLLLLVTALPTVLSLQCFHCGPYLSAPSRQCKGTPKAVDCTASKGCVFNHAEKEVGISVVLVVNCWLLHKLLTGAWFYIFLILLIYSLWWWVMFNFSCRFAWFIWNLFVLLLLLLFLEIRCKVWVGDRKLE